MKTNQVSASALVFSSSKYQPASKVTVPNFPENFALNSNGFPWPCTKYPFSNILQFKRRIAVEPNGALDQIPTVTSNKRKPQFEYLI